ncbi:MAG: hypothetical protein ACFFCT_02305 [Candidatus Odinarchaeota archaeon]
MAEDDNRAKILKAVKDHVRQSEEQQRVQMIADAIGERRDRDLLDIISSIEQDRGWPETLQHLQKAQNFSYSLPVGTGPLKIKVEDLKFREMLFSVLGCRGLEPIPVNTEEILTQMKDERSIVDASDSIRKYIESIARNQIETGDSLFFDSNDFDIQVSEDITQMIEQLKHKEVQGITLEQKNDSINVAPLWYCETGRQILSSYGIKGFIIGAKHLEEVLSVIQFPVVINNVNQYTAQQEQSKYPSNQSYRDLHNSIINHDDERLSLLSSRHSFSTLKSMLEETLDVYNKDSSSENYRQFLHLIHLHVKVRTLDSIQLLERLAYLKDRRIATVAITALGNYYHESAAIALVEILCKSKNREIVKTATNAILNVGKRSPETVSVIATALESSTCTYKGRLNRLWREFGKKHQLYY